MSSENRLSPSCNSLDTASVTQLNASDSIVLERLHEIRRPFDPSLHPTNVNCIFGEIEDQSTCLKLSTEPCTCFLGAHRPNPEETGKLLVEHALHIMEAQYRNHSHNALGKRHSNI